MSIKEKLTRLEPHQKHLLENGTASELRGDILEILEDTSKIPLIYGGGGGNDIMRIGPKQPDEASVTIANFKLGVNYACEGGFNALYAFHIFEGRPNKDYNGLGFLEIYLSIERHDFSLKFKYDSGGGVYVPFTSEESPNKEVFDRMRRFMGPL